MLKYEGLKIMREMRLENPDTRDPKASLHDMVDEDAPKTRGDGAPITLVDLIMDARYAEREQDSDYYQEDYYFSESDGEEREEEGEEREEEGEEKEEDMYGDEYYDEEEESK